NTPSRDALRSAECAQATFSGFLDAILRRASTLNATLFDKPNNPVQPQIIFDAIFRLRAWLSLAFRLTGKRCSIDMIWINRGK
ncbi:MAG: hypothetical protein LBT59_02850, partial [Clostridiales bacterium]|nr:hypothetical protein [Clostridiales bacterium]